MANEDYSKFIPAKLEYSREDLFKQVFFEYHSIIEVFMKSNTNVIAEHRPDWDHKIYFNEGKMASVIQNSIFDDFSSFRIFHTEQFPVTLNGKVLGIYIDHIVYIWIWMWLAMLIGLVNLFLLCPS